MIIFEIFVDGRIMIDFKPAGAKFNTQYYHAGFTFFLVFILENLVVVLSYY